MIGGETDRHHRAERMAQNRDALNFQHVEEQFCIIGELRRAVAALRSIGSAMAANKVPGIRAAPCVDEASARNAREHNDANVLTLGARFVDATKMRSIVEVFLTTHCTEERHARRVGKIKAIEDTFAK